ncbi:MAG: class I adenylate cyclase, partial [Nitrospinota bacterium]
GYVRRWGWDLERLRELNQFRFWPFEKAVGFGREINRFILEAYKRLGDLSERNVIKRTTISATDLTLLGRKLFTFFARKPNKVEFLPRGIEESFYQEALTLCPSRTQEGQQFWRLYRGHVSLEDILQGRADHLLLRRAASLPALFCWVVNNGMYDRDSTLSLIPSDLPLTVPDFQELLNELLDYFPRLEISRLGKEELLQESRLERLFVILNFGREKHLSQLSRVEVCYRNTWGELFYEGWDGMKGMEEGLEKVLRKLPEGRPSSEVPVKLFIPSGRTGPFARSLWLNFERLLRESSEFFLAAPPSGKELRHFVFQEGAGLKALCQREGELELSRHASEEEFCNSLDRTGSAVNLVRVDSGSAGLDLLRTVTEASRAGRVQFFFHDDGVQLRAFLSDEMCSMLAYSWPRQEWEFHAAKLYSFMARILVRKVNGGPAPAAWPLEFFEITSGRPPLSSLGLQDVTHEFQRKSLSRSALGEQLSVREEPLPGVEDALSFKVGEEEITSSKFGKGVFREVARRVLERRREKVRYPIYLTELELPRSFCEAHCPRGPQTVHFLLYKQRVERWLNQALREL